MRDRWSEATPRRHRWVERIRWAAVVVLVGVVIGDVFATAAGRFDGPSAGECGAIACASPGMTKGVSIAIVLALLALLLASWPSLVRRYRDLWS